MSRALGVLFVATAMVACGVEGDEAAEDVTEIAQPIMNGSTDFTGLEWMRIRTARIERVAPNGCSGTILDPRTILTARHCVTDNGRPDGLLISPSAIRVKIDGGTFRAVSGIHATDTQHDAALVYVSSANRFLTAEGHAIFTPMEVNPPTTYVGHEILISGWGDNRPLTGRGVLRHGRMIVDDDYVPTFPDRPNVRDGIVLRLGPSGHSHGPSDSGGPYWGDTRVEGTLPRGVIGLHSINKTGAHVNTIRKWARGEMSLHHGKRRYVTRSFFFSSASDLNKASFFNPGGNPASWSVTGGMLVQSRNVGPTHIVWQDHVVRDFTATVEIVGTDDDGAGITFHHVQPDFYYCEANDAENVLAIRSRINNVITTHASTPWYGTFATIKTMTVQGDDDYYGCRFDGVTVAATLTRMPVGAIGLFQDHHEGVRFDNLEIIGG